MTMTCLILVIPAPDVFAGVPAEVLGEVPPVEDDEGGLVGGPAVEWWVALHDAEIRRTALAHATRASRCRFGFTPFVLPRHAAARLATYLPLHTIYVGRDFGLGPPTGRLNEGLACAQIATLCG
jgi:hypothetical protein